MLLSSNIDMKLGDNIVICKIFDKHIKVLIVSFILFLNEDEKRERKNRNKIDSSVLKLQRERERERERKKNGLKKLESVKSWRHDSSRPSSLTYKISWWFV
jgi:hypothetical protein